MTRISSNKLSSHSCNFRKQFIFAYKFSIKRQITPSKTMVSDLSQNSVLLSIHLMSETWAPIDKILGGGK